MTFQLLRRSRTSIIPLVIGENGEAESGSAGGSPAKQAQQHPAFARKGADDASSQAASADARGPASSKSAGAASAWAAKPVSHASGPHAEVDVAGVEPADCNRFAKFTAAQDAAPLWQRAARELAQYAAQVCSLVFHDKMI